MLSILLVITRNAHGAEEGEGLGSRLYIRTYVRGRGYAHGALRCAADSTGRGITDNIQCTFLGYNNLIYMYINFVQITRCTSVHNVESIWCH